MTRAVKKKLKAIAEKMPLVHTAGYTEGLADGEGQGGIAEEALALITKHMRKYVTNYDNLFDGSSLGDAEFSVIMANWKADGNATFKNASYMFRNTKNVSEALYTDNLDFSGCVSLLSAFEGSTVKKLKAINAISTVDGWSGMANMFYLSSIESIEAFYPSKNTTFNGTFTQSYNLKRVIFESEIAVDKLNLGYSKSLDRDSIESVVKNLSLNTSGLSVTISETALNNAFEGGENNADWLDLIAGITNWNITIQDYQ